MNTVEFVGLYFLFVFVQAVLIARYGVEETETPVLCVVFFMLFAPVATVSILAMCVYLFVKWLVVAGVKK